MARTHPWFSRCWRGWIYNTGGKQASVGRSLNLLTCKRAEQLDAIRSSVLAMLTLCQQGDTQIQTDSADTKAYDSSPLSPEMSDWA